MNSFDSGLRPDESSPNQKRNQPATGGHRILLLGDSNTDWGRTKDGNETWERCSESQPISYAGQLQKIVNDNEGRRFAVINRGFSGAKVGELIGHIESAGEVDPTMLRGADAIVIAVGINDITGGTAIQKFQKEYSQLLSLVKSHNPHSAIILLTPYLLNNKYPELFSTLHTVIAVIQEEGTNHKVSSVIDVQSILGGVALNDYPDPYWNASLNCRFDPNDGIHPSTNGHSIIANELRHRLERLLDPAVRNGGASLAAE